MSRMARGARRLLARMDIDRRLLALGRGVTADLLFQIEPDGYAAGGAKLTIVDARSPA